MEFIFITPDPDIARHVDACGVDRIMVDLEILGKQERQKGRNTIISGHTLDDVARVREALSDAKLLVRVNPIHEGSEKEIREVIERGADIVMLPMFRTRAEVEAFVAFVGGKARTCLLLETPQALVRVDDILAVEGIDELHVGLNDLHLAMGLESMFELVSGGIVDHLAQKVKAKGIRFGFGGIAKLGGGAIDSRLVGSEHVRLGSELVILSRAFHGGAKSVEELVATIDMKSEIDKIRAHMASLSQSGPDVLRQNHERLVQLVTSQVAASKKEPSS